MLLNLYNDNHEHKIKLEKVEEIYVKDDKLCIVCKEYDDEGSLFGYADYTMDITLNQSTSKTGCWTKERNLKK